MQEWLMGPCDWNGMVNILYDIVVEMCIPTDRAGVWWER